MTASALARRVCGLQMARRPEAMHRAVMAVTVQSRWVHLGEEGDNLWIMIVYFGVPI